MPVAEMLRHERERRGVTLEQLAEETKVPVDRLAAFEREGLALNGGFYQRARIRAYAHALNLDERVVMEQLEQDLMAAAPPPPAPDPPSRRFPVFPVALSVGCLIAVAVIGSQLLKSDAETSRAAGYSRSAAQPGDERERPLRAVDVDRTVANVSLVSVATAGTTEPVAASIAPLATVAPAATQLKITSQPEGARVTVDGIGWGVTPVTIRHLSEGAKRIRVTSDGYASVERVVHVSPERGSSVSFQLRTISDAVDSRP